MSKSIHYVTCPKCNGEFYVTPSFFEITAPKCYCPFCTFEFSALDDKKAATRHSALVSFFVLLQATLWYLMAVLLVAIPFVPVVEAAPPYPSEPFTFGKLNYLEEVL